MEHKDLENEIEDLRDELETFQKEKERVRVILGKIGGVPKFHTKLANISFIIFIIVSLVLSFIGGNRWKLVMIEIAMVALSLKIMYLIHCQMRVNHFKLWMLSSIEWRLNEMMKRIKDMQK